MGETFRFDAQFNVVNACCVSEDTFDVVHDLPKTPLKVSCDVYMHAKSPGLSYDNILPNSLDHSHVFPICSHLCLSFENFFHVPIDNPMLYESNVDLGCEDMFDVFGENVDHVMSLGY